MGYKLFTETDSWIKLSFHPQCASILPPHQDLDDDTISSSPDVSPFLLRAMQNVHLSLAELRIYEVAVSTTFTFSEVITTAFPPSSARFHQPNGDVIIKPILQFLERTNSSFLIQIQLLNSNRICSVRRITFRFQRRSPHRS